MSLQWTFIAGYLYFEIALVMIMILPIFSPRRWYRLLHSRLLEIFHERTAFYFYGWLCILCLFLFDSVREMKKYSHPSDSVHVHLSTEMKGNVKLFRAQRNFYITGFSIFLAFVIRRLIKMIIIQYQLEVKAEQIIKKAEDTVKQAKTTILANAHIEETHMYEEIKSKLEVTEILLQEQKTRVKELEVEAQKWRVKYEDIKMITDGHGDN